MPQPALSPLKVTLILGAFVALGPLTVDFYLPALPSITTDLMTTDAAVQLTLTGTFAGLALGQVVLGPLSDALGRRRPLLAGTALHVLASLLIVVAPSVEVLGALRVLQGIGSAAGAVVALAVVRDLYSGRAAASLLSRLFLVIGVAPVLAPTLGGELLRVTSWRGLFVVLAAIGLASLLAVALTLPETLPADRRHPFRLRRTAVDYGRLFGDRAYVGLVLVAGLTIAGLFSYVSGASFVYQQQFGLDEQQFGLLFGAGAVFLIGTTQLTPVLLRRTSPQVLLVVGVLAGLVSAVLLIVTAATGFGGLFGVAVPLWLVLASAGLALPNAPALALSRHGESAGTAAALLGAVQFGVGAAVSPVVGLLGNDALALATVVLSSAVLAVAVLFLVVRPGSLPDVDEGAADDVLAESAPTGHHQR